MAEPHWDSFEWDHENRKNGNVQHLRDQGIEPDEAEECFFHDYIFALDTRRFHDVYVKKLKTVAESEGEPEYQAMVQRWVKERLQQATKPASTRLQNRSR